MDKLEKLSGIGGWLLFFIITLAFITPIGILYYVSSDYYIIDGQFDSGLALISIGFGVWAIIVGIALWRKNPKAVVWAKEFLLSYLIFSIVSIIVGAILGGYSSDPELLAEDSVSLIRAIGYFAIWFSYLNVSKRVKNTFKERKLKIGRISLIIIITVVVFFFLILFFSPYYFETETVAIDTTPKPLTDTLTGGYLQYHEFTDQYAVQNISLHFTSLGGAIDVYMVRSEDEFDKFINGENIDTYQGCYKKNTQSGDINCIVQTGGIIVYNPNNWNITYTLELKY